MSDISPGTTIDVSLSITINEVIKRIGTITGDYVPPTPPPAPEPEDPNVDLPTDPGAVSDFYEEVDIATPAGHAITGFAPIVVHSDTKQIWLSDDLGNDSNSGLAENAPKKTLQAALNLLEQGRSCILYQRTGENKLWDWRPSGNESSIRNAIRGGESGSKPVIFTWYGDSKAHRPKNIPPSTLDRIYQNNIWFIGLEWRAPTPESSYYTLVFNRIGKNIVVEDCYFRNVELILMGDGSDINRCPEYVSVRSNIFDTIFWRGSSSGQSSRPSGIYLEHSKDVTIEKNVFYRCGWSPNFADSGANQYNHGLYLSHNNYTNTLVFRNNVIIEPAHNASQLRHGGTTEDNFSTRSSTGFFTSCNFLGRPFIMRRNVSDLTWPQLRAAGTCQNSVCTNAQWHFRYGLNVAETGCIHQDNIAQRHIVAGQEDPDYPGSGQIAVPLVAPFASGAYSRGSFTVNPDTPSGNIPLLQESGNIAWHAANATEGDNINYVDPGRTLADYFSFLTDTTMEYADCIPVFLNRGIYQDNPLIHAVGINAYIRAGYAIED